MSEPRAGTLPLATALAVLLALLPADPIQQTSARPLLGPGTAAADDCGPVGAPGSEASVAWNTCHRRLGYTDQVVSELAGNRGMTQEQARQTFEQLVEKEASCLRANRTTAAGCSDEFWLGVRRGDSGFQIRDTAVANLRADLIEKGYDEAAINEAAAKMSACYTAALSGEGGVSAKENICITNVTAFLPPPSAAAGATTVPPGATTVPPGEEPAKPPQQLGPVAPEPPEPAGNDAVRPRQYHWSRSTRRALPSVSRAG